MWDLPGPGLEPMSPTLAGGFLTTAPPGKPLHIVLALLHSFNIQPQWAMASSLLTTILLENSIKLKCPFLLGGFSVIIPP